MGRTFRKIKNFVEYHSGEILYILMLIFFSILTTCGIRYAQWSEKETVDLMPIDEYYVYYHEVYSTVPADNYNVVTIRRKTDSMMVTFKGDTIFHLEEDIKEPYAIITYSHLVNGDKIELYVPVNSIKFTNNVGLK